MGSDSFGRSRNSQLRGREHRRRFVEQIKIHGAWVPLYRFGLHEYLPPDYEVFNWYLSNHPNSIFVTGLMAAATVSSSLLAIDGSAKHFDQSVFVEPGHEGFICKDRDSVR